MTKKRPALWRDAGVEDLCNRGMRHERQRLALGFESRDDLRGIHARFDDFQRDLAMDGTGLFGEPDFAHAAFSHSLEKAVRANRFRRSIRRRRLGDVVAHTGAILPRRSVC